MGTAAESLFATLFPGDCRICNSPLLNISRLPVCKNCLDAIHPIAGRTCCVCGERIFTPHAQAEAEAEAAETPCGLCLRIEHPFVRATAYGSYDGGLRELIHLLKYEQVRPAANALGGMLSEAIHRLTNQLTPAFADAPILVVPVPLHRVKLRQREFNQSELIARAALKIIQAGAGSSDRFVLKPHALVRARATQSQIGLTSHQRRENIRGAFLVARPAEVVGRQILLIDDVFTTGTTVSECARVLRRAGASNVWVATVARTLKIAGSPLEPVNLLEPGNLIATQTPGGNA